MTTKQVSNEATLEAPQPSNQTEAVSKQNANKRSGQKSADLWLNALLAPHKSDLRTKSWLDVAAGLMSIPQAAFLAAAIGVLFIDKAGLKGVLPYAIGLFVVIAARAGFSYFAGRIGHKVSAHVRRDLRFKLAQVLASQAPLDTERKSAGEVAALGSDIIEKLDAYASRYLSIKLQLAVVPLTIALAAASVSWVVACILLLCGPLVPVFMAIVGLRAKKASDNQISALSDMSESFLDRISGMTTLRLFRAVGRTRAEFEGLADDYRHATMKVLRVAFLSSAALELFSALGIALTAIYVAYHYLGYADFGSYGVPITISTGVFVLMLAPDFFAPLREFSASYHDRATARSAAERLSQMLPLESVSQTETPVAPNDTTQSTQPNSSPPITSIAFKACDLGYSSDRGAVISNFTGSYVTGESVAILGASGAGKSTVLAALCGFLAPISGELEINQQRVQDDQARWDTLRETIAWIGQRPHIFHGSVLMNARLAAPESDRSQVRAALSQAHAEHFVAQLPRDLLTILGETGFGISGGQVRRLAIARALLSRSSLVLCDEPTADLDADTAHLVTDSLMQMAKDRLLIVATHDRAVAERCDRILYVRDGNIQEISNEELDTIDAADLLGIEATEGGREL
ncbi:thiol reductant ABC exporter subunit CydD [Cohaesibacter celericrescens]|uniref:thiol reductant ABC exporter subunit CydD n=1 Tax=Cohaesibacter celericrescens TaxID=2067669 RepID=UPI00356800B8